MRRAEISDVYTDERSIIRRDATCGNLMWPKTTLLQIHTIRSNALITRIILNIPSLRLSINYRQTHQFLHSLEKGKSSEKSLGTTNVKFVTRHDPWTLFIDDRRSIGQIAPRYFNESMFGEDWRSTRFENFHASIFRSVD